MSRPRFQASEVDRKRRLDAAQPREVDVELIIAELPHHGLSDLNG